MQIQFVGELKINYVSILISINNVRFFLFIVLGRCNVFDEWCGWISQNDIKVRWSLKMVIELIRVGKYIINYVSYDEGKKFEEM